jgi:hypothetical protein
MPASEPIVPRPALPRTAPARATVATIPPCPGTAPCLATRHRPGRTQTDVAGVRRARCQRCGLQLMRTAISRRWIIADQLG